MKDFATILLHICFIGLYCSDFTLGKPQGYNIEEPSISFPSPRDSNLGISQNTVQESSGYNYNEPSQSFNFVAGQPQLSTGVSQQQIQNVIPSFIQPAQLPSQPQFSNVGALSQNFISSSPESQSVNTNVTESLSSSLSGYNYQQPAQSFQLPQQNSQTPTHSLASQGSSLSVGDSQSLQFIAGQSELGYNYNQPIQSLQFVASQQTNPAPSVSQQSIQNNQLQLSNVAQSGIQQQPSLSSQPTQYQYETPPVALSLGATQGQSGVPSGSISNNQFQQQLSQSSIGSSIQQPSTSGQQNEYNYEEPSIQFVASQGQSLSEPQVPAQNIPINPSQFQIISLPQLLSQLGGSSNLQIASQGSQSGGFINDLSGSVATSGGQTFQQHQSLEQSSGQLAANAGQVGSISSIQNQGNFINVPSGNAATFGAQQLQQFQSLQQSNDQSTGVQTVGSQGTIGTIAQIPSSVQPAQVFSNQQALNGQFAFAQQGQSGGISTISSNNQASSNIGQTSSIAQSSQQYQPSQSSSLNGQAVLSQSQSNTIQNQALATPTVPATVNTQLSGGNALGSSAGLNQYTSEYQSVDASYDFAWKVDAVGPNGYPVLYGQEENREGINTRGRYYVLLPDTRLMTVEYTADAMGFHPVYKYEGTAVQSPSVGAPAIQTGYQ